jgi:hypothetical protein
VFVDYYIVGDFGNKTLKTMRERTHLRTKRKGFLANWVMSDWLALITIAAGFTAFLISEMRRIDELSVRMDKYDYVVADIFKTLTRIEEDIDEMKVDLKSMNADLKATNDLLHTHLMWEYVYQSDKGKRDIVPKYDPIKRTLELAEAKRDSTRK